MQVKNYISKYSASKSKAHVNYYKIPATEKWVEYQLDITDMNKVLMSLPFNDKIRMLDALTIAERKRDYMYRHPNFNFTKATRWYQLAKDLPKK